MNSNKPWPLSYSWSLTSALETTTLGENTSTCTCTFSNVLWKPFGRGTVHSVVVTSIEWELNAFISPWAPINVQLHVHAPQADTSINLRFSGGFGQSL